jgi:glycine/D-amino acid oxidase-like deaminating enzyme
MPHATADIAIIGAGIAGIASAYHLAVRRGLTGIVLIDERPPLTLTSDKSTEAYRNYWPGPDAAMVRLMNRSIDLLEEFARASDNRILLNRRGYLYATADPDRAAAFRAEAALAAEQGAGPLRVHDGRGDSSYEPAHAEGFSSPLTGADLLLDPALIRAHFPYLSEKIIAALHVRRCGWFSGQQLGMFLLEEARARGVRLLEGRVEAISTRGGRITDVAISVPGGRQVLAVGQVVIAAGPLIQPAAQMIGLTLPVFSELHLKASFRDSLGIIPRSAPLLIGEDAQVFDWTDEERAALLDDPALRWLAGTLPPGVHARPEGPPDGDRILILWPCHTPPAPEVFPIPIDPLYAEVAMRGMSALVPGLRAYVERMPKPFVDGGYYTKTRENRPLIGPLPVEGAYLIGALSGFGLMAASAAGELLAAHVAGSALPPWANAFRLERCDDPAYVRRSEAWGSTGQL